MGVAQFLPDDLAFRVLLASKVEELIKQLGEVVQG